MDFHDLFSLLYFTLALIVSNKLLILYSRIYFSQVIGWTETEKWVELEETKLEFKEFPSCSFQVTKKTF